MYVMTCLCGREHHRADADAFYCHCGRPAVIDHAMRYSDKELLALLTALHVQRDERCKLIGIRSQAA